MENIEKKTVKISAMQNSLNSISTKTRRKKIMFHLNFQNFSTVEKRKTKKEKMEKSRGRESKNKPKSVFTPHFGSLFTIEF